MKQCLFVYGTLGPGRPNEHILSAIGGTWEEATVRGHLQEQGWGAEMGYPGIVLDDTGDTIIGFIFCSDNLRDHWDELDLFEGEEYKRISAKVQKNNKSTTEAQIYVLRDSLQENSHFSGSQGRRE